MIQLPSRALVAWSSLWATNFTGIQAKLDRATRKGEGEFPRPVSFSGFSAYARNFPPRKNESKSAMSAARAKNQAPKETQPKQATPSWMTPLTVAIAIFAIVYAITITYNVPFTLFGQARNETRMASLGSRLGLNASAGRVKYVLCLDFTFLMFFFLPTRAACFQLR